MPRFLRSFLHIRCWRLSSPPITITPTMHNQQKFILINLDKQEVIDWNLLLPEVLFGRQKIKLLVGLLAKPPPVEERALASILTDLRTRHGADRETSPDDADLLIDGLSQAILQNSDDALRAALTTFCKRSVIDVLHTRVSSLSPLGSFGTWQGDRIICLGDKTTAEDLPLRIFTEEEQQKLTSPPICYPEGFRSSLLCNFRNVRAREDFIEYYPDDGKSACALHTALPPSAKVILNFAYRPSFSRPVVEQGATEPVWVLCNISKLLYVRVNAIAALSNSATEGPKVHGRIGLEHLLVLQILWASDCSVKAMHRNIHQGPWVGDRFAFTTMDRIGEYANSDWTDWSTEAVLLVRNIWGHVLPVALPVP
ncbi:uncharacterized protein LAESUDRAFT_174126 [Laetiporus sulphureus 93-53]|uniref:Uncharacterized protein n=1 Tax=Laetiporus sulphureus 93-53 TaxID=1314785 RepID=A0A165HWW5_9APHY|nr:uncharacterized protein LAESUDRAFT_174126 [Laetiporus sulphureus 93-53]KZT12296.1 hypothetical protein LAESUDRAFT_174126 [Laetiporus sulphureus 93-53]